jgi:hypothetical protein
MPERHTNPVKDKRLERESNALIIFFAKVIALKNYSLKIFLKLYV